VSLVADSSTLEATVRSLAGFTAERAPITTCYLDVDGRRHPRHVDVEHAVDRAREAALVDRLRAAVASGARGVAGLGPVLSALNERRVERLLLSEGYEEEGWRCPDSGALAEVGPTSPVTGGRMDKVLDVVEDAIELALNQGCKVDVCVGNADLDVLGRIGALLRY